jgi:hypothetical protein
VERRANLRLLRFGGTPSREGFELPRTDDGGQDHDRARRAQAGGAFNVEPGMVMTEKMEINQRDMGLENKFPVAPPSVPASVVAWLCTDPAAAERNGESFTAQRFAKDEGLHEPWW